jgi:cytochrome c553
MLKEKMLDTLTDRLAPLAFAALFAAAATIPAGAEPANRGEMLQGCAPCHGADGIGRDAEIPNLAGQNQAYLYNQLKAFHDGRRAHKEMLYMSRKMTDEDMRALAAYFSSLPPR